MSKLQELEQRKAEAINARDRIDARRREVADWQAALAAERQRLQANRDGLLRRVALGEADDTERQAANRRVVEIEQDIADAERMAAILEREVKPTLANLRGANEALDDHKHRERLAKIREHAKVAERRGESRHTIILSLNKTFGTNRGEINQALGAGWV